MLNRLKKDDTQKIQSVINAQPGLNARVSALIKAYGTDQRFFNVWHQDFDTVIARLEGSFFVCEGKNTDFEELAFFLNFNPYFSRLSGKADVVEKISRFLTVEHEYRRCDFMTMPLKTAKSREKTLNKNDFEIDSSPKLKNVYDVIFESQSDEFRIGGFEPWYVDVSHRIRHGCARAYLLKDEGGPRSACVVSAESDFAGLISGVATIPQLRGRGFATAAVSRACCDLAQCGKQPVLECLPSLAGFYGKLGFEKTAEVEELSII